MLFLSDTNLLVSILEAICHRLRNSVMRVWKVEQTSPGYALGPRGKGWPDRGKACGAGGTVQGGHRSFPHHSTAQLEATYALLSHYWDFTIISHLWL
jgi:hypothetical protein